MAAMLSRAQLGQCVMTQGVAALIDRHRWLVAAMAHWFPQHARGVCPNLDSGDRRANEQAIRDGGRIFTAWRTLLPEAPMVWIITEADRSRTTLLLPDEY